MGNYISKNLENGEELRLQGKLHWACLIPNIISFFLFVMVFIFLLVFFNSIDESITDEPILIFELALIFIFPTLKLIKKIIWILTTEIGFTNKKVMGKVGLINTKVMNSPLGKINNVSVKTGLFGKILGYGTLRINTSSSWYRFRYIKDAEEFRSSLLQTIEQYEQDKTISRINGGE